MTFNHNPIEIPKIEQVNSEHSGRYYQTPDGNFPSITTILGSRNNDALDEWRARVGDEQADKISRQAANRGTRMHHYCEQYLRNNDVIIKNPFDLELFRKIKYHLDHVDDIVLLETALWSKKLKVAGTVDCVAKFKDLAIIDFKTSLKPKKREWIDNYWLQTCAYSVMFEEQTGIVIDRLVLMISNEEGSCQVFIDWRNNWINQLEDVLSEYYR